MDYNIIEMIKSDKAYPESLNEFLNYLLTIKSASPNTIYAYKFDLILFFRYMKLLKSNVNEGLEFEQIPINDIDIEFIKKINLNDLYSFMKFSETYRSNGSYARARKVACLKSFFKFLQIKSKSIIDNPALELESPKIMKRQPVYLSLSESKTLLSSLKKDSKNYIRDYAIITLFLNCGLRVSELCNINITNIKEDTLTIIGKGDKERTVYLNDTTLNAINEYLKIRVKSYLPFEEFKDALFLSTKHYRISKRSVERLVKKHTLHAGLNKKKYTPHKLRHTAATLMYKYGHVDIRSLQMILGHENISTTQIYTHIDNETLREAVKSNPLNEDNYIKIKNKKDDF